MTLLESSLRPPRPKHLQMNNLVDDRIGKTNQQPEELLLSAATALASISSQSHEIKQLSSLSQKNIQRVHYRQELRRGPALGMKRVSFGPSSFYDGADIDSAGPEQMNAFYDHVSSKSHNEKVTRFPILLMQILSSGVYDHILAWAHDGFSFVVTKPNLLVTEVLPLYFMESKYSSFTRKLRRWGFINILMGKEPSAYYHKQFRRGDDDTCSRMSCQKKCPGESDAVSHFIFQKHVVPRMQSHVRIEHEVQIKQEQRESLLQQQLQLQKGQFHEQLSRGVKNVPTFHNEETFVNHTHHYEKPMTYPHRMPVQRQVMISECGIIYRNREQIACAPMPYLSNVGRSNGGSNPTMMASFLPSVKELQLERQRRSAEHKQIMRNAMQALKLEKLQKRVFQGSHHRNFSYRH